MIGSRIELEYQKELENYKMDFANRNYSVAWNHLERAHVIVQFHAMKHFWVHILMLVHSLKTFNFNEALGQIPRLFLAIPGSITGRAPKGNTGGANVGMFTPMEIPEDLRAILELEKTIYK